MLTLWDMLTQRDDARPATKRRRRPRAQASPPMVVAAPRTPATPVEAAATPQPVPPEFRTMRERYDWVTREMLAAHSVRVRKWRAGMSGVAWQVTYADGTVSRLIEAPRPRGPMSAAVFLHEIGHHAIGFHTYSPRCLEEHMAWMFSIDTMRRYELNITEAVMRRVRQSMRYAIAKARRRGIKQVPCELAIYLTQPEREALGLAPPESHETSAAAA